MRLLAAAATTSLILAAFAGVAACGARTDEGLLDGFTQAAVPDASLVDHSVDAHKPPPPDATPPQPDVVYIPQAARCVRDGGAPPSFAGDLDASFDANFPRAPQVLAQGGPVVALPTFVPVTFPGDPLANQEEDFIDSVGCTPYWRTIASDYGVGQAVGGPHTRLTEAAQTQIDDNQIQQWLATKIKSTPNFPQPDASTVYVIFYPDTTTITLQGQSSCQAFGGYHNSARVGGKDVPYAVVPNCGSFGPLQGIDAITGATSHELIEAVSDAVPLSNPAYGTTEPAALGFLLAGGVELGDMCEFKSDAFFAPTGYPFTVQRSWSNKTGFGLNDPCQPALPGPYFSAQARPKDIISIDLGMGPQPVPGVKLPVGQTTTVDVIAFAQPNAGSWKLATYDAAQLRGQPPELGLSLSQGGVTDGTLVKLTVTRKKASQFGVSAFGIVSTNGQRQSFSWHLVGD